MEPIWLMWLLPILFVIHDGEEVLTWSWWMERKGMHIFAFRRKPGGEAWASKNSRQMVVSVSVVGAVLLAVTIQGVRAMTAGATPYLFAAILGIWLLHSGLHVASAVYHRMYSPGVITGVLLCMPHGVITYRSLLGAGVLTWTQALVAGAAGVAVLPIGLKVVHRVGQAVGKSRHH